ncbi:hypothetical protein FF1_007819 [Malus domestica]
MFIVLVFSYWKLLAGETTQRTGKRKKAFNFLIGHDF